MNINLQRPRTHTDPVPKRNTAPDIRNPADRTPPGETAGLIQVFIDAWAESIVIRPGDSSPDVRIPLRDCDTLERCLARIISLKRRVWAVPAALRRILVLAAEYYGYAVPDRIWREATLYYQTDELEPTSTRREKLEYLTHGPPARDRDTGNVPPAEMTQMSLHLEKCLARKSLRDSITEASKAMKRGDTLGAALAKKRAARNQAKVEACEILLNRKK